MRIKQAFLGIFLLLITLSHALAEIKSITSSDGTEIVYEVEGTGPTIVFLHGLTGDRNYWANFGYNPMLENYRLVLIDARGHGESGVPSDENGYLAERFVEDIERIVEAETTSPPIFWGYSMGAAFGYHVMLNDPELFSHYVLGDGNIGIYGPDQENQERGRMQAMALRSGQGFAANFSVSQRNAFADFLETDRTEETANIRANLGTIDVPTFMYITGESLEGVPADEQRTGFVIQDQFNNMTYREFPDLDHLAGWRRSDLVVPMVLEFLAEN